MATMQDLIAERADAYMRHCVAGVTQQGKDKAAAFAICKAGGNRAGYYQPGTKTKTAKGTKAIRAHARAKDAPGKDAAYDRAVKSEGVMSMKALIEGLLAEGVPANWSAVTSGMNAAWRNPHQTPQDVQNARAAAENKAILVQDASAKVANLVAGLDRPATDPRMQAAVIQLNKAVEGLLFQVGFAHGAAHPDTEE